MAVNNMSFLVGSDHRDWYHGELTREEAEQALKVSGCDCFLVRQSRGVPVLSFIQGGGSFTHTKIVSGQHGYMLTGSSRAFSELPELISHYHTKLGQVCAKS
jgi:hypothetical protein